MQTSSKLILCAGGAFLLAGCAAAAKLADPGGVVDKGLQDMVAGGKITAEVAEQVRLMVHGLLSGETSFMDTVLEIGKFAGAMVGSVFGVNIMRNRARVARGEPVGTPPLVRAPVTPTTPVTPS